MRWYIRNGHGCPTELYDDRAVDDECWKWDLILEKIAQGFEAIQELDDKEWCDIPKSTKKELTKKFKKGMYLFAKHFRNLWD